MIISTILSQLNPSDHDLLIQLIQQVNYLQKLMENHLAHHTIYTITLLTAFLSLSGGIILILMKQYAAKKREKN